jgi:hypothetical protein
MRSLVVVVAMAATASANPGAMPKTCGPASMTRHARVTRRVPAPKGDPIAALDPELLAYLGLAIPRGLDFNPNDAAIRRRSEAWFAAWATRKNASAQALTAKYTAAAALVAPDRALEAYARMGQIIDDYSASLFVEPIPAQILTAPDAEGLATAFCDAMTAAAEPLEERAVVFYDRCLQQATKTMVANEWSEWCERRLNELAPELYPVREELLGSPRASPVIMPESPAK